MKVEYVLPINKFIFVLEKSKQRDNLRNMKFGRTHAKNPVAVHFLYMETIVSI